MQIEINLIGGSKALDSCSIEKAKLGGQAGVLGAAALAIME